MGTSCRKEDNSVINFRPVDLEGIITPHKDTLVIRATIANYEVAQIFVDSGCSMNFLFKEAFDQMQIDHVELQPLSTSLFGFAGDEVCP